MHACAWAAWACTDMHPCMRGPTLVCPSVLEVCEAQSFHGTAGLKRRKSVVEKCRRPQHGHCPLQVLYANFCYTYSTQRMYWSKHFAIHRLDMMIQLLFLAAVSKRCKVAVQQSQRHTASDPINLFQLETSSLTLFHCCVLSVACHHGGCSGYFH